MAKRRKKKQERGVALLSELVRRVYPSAEPDEQRLVRVAGWWESRMPERITRNARPARFSQGKLVIHTATGAWAQELTLLLPRYISELAHAIPAVDPKQVRVQVGALPPRPVVASRPPIVAALEISQLPSAVARALARISDDQVRDAVAHAAAQSLATQSLATQATQPAVGTSPMTQPARKIGSSVESLTGDHGPRQGPKRVW